MLSTVEVCAGRHPSFLVRRKVVFAGDLSGLLPTGRWLGILYCLAYWFFAAFSGMPAYAADLRLAVARSAQDEQFIKSLQTSPTLRGLGLRVSTATFSNSGQIIDALKRGDANLAVFTLDSLARSEQASKKPLTIAAILAQPFQFQSSDELVNVLGTTFGTSVLADISRTGLVPLALWNRGLSEIVSERPIGKSFVFANFRVAAQSPEAVSVLRALGSDATLARDEEQPSELLARSQIDSVEVGADEFLKGIKGSRSVVSGFRPLISVVAANPDYWNTLSEEQKSAIASVAADASTKAVLMARANEQSARKKAWSENFSYVEFDEGQLSRFRDISTRVLFKDGSIPDIEWQTKSLDDAKAEAQQGLKKRLK